MPIKRTLWTVLIGLRITGPAGRGGDIAPIEGVGAFVGWC